VPNIELQPKHDLSTFRRIAIGTWTTVGDPSVYGTMQIEMDAAMDYIARYREATGKRLTVSHLVAKAIAGCLERMPDANAIIRWNRPRRRKTIGVFFQVAMPGQGKHETDLSGATLYDVEKKTVDQLVDEFAEKVQTVRDRKDPALEKTRNSFKVIPLLAMNLVLKLISFLSYTLNLDLRWAGIPSDPFGSIMVTNVGSLGLDTAYVPLVPYSHVPMLLALGAVKKTPVVDENDQIVIRKTMGIHATFDHRIIDGFHAAVMSKVLREYFANPDEKFGAIPGAKPAAKTTEPFDDPEPAKAEAGDTAPEPAVEDPPVAASEADDGSDAGPEPADESAAEPAASN
jgi:pyruvate dehydrogenase E2 component (dihydrolipoamide acetyltransferase)